MKRTRPAKVFARQPDRVGAFSFASVRLGQPQNECGIIQVENVFQTPLPRCR
jgi:hypothetical protein